MIFITGCAGYIGYRFAINMLDQGSGVKGLILPEQRKQIQPLVEKGLKVYVGDITETELPKNALRDVTTFYHLAGGHFSTAEKMKKIYVEGTKRMLDYCREVPIESFVLAGNGSVYGDCKDTVIQEEQPLQVEHPFGRISLETEALALAYRKQYGIPVTILRIGEVYGDGQYNLLLGAQQKKLNLLGDGYNYNSRIHIDDVIRILDILNDGNFQGEILNVADDEPITQRKFYAYLHNTYRTLEPNWIGSEGMVNRIRLSIHGLRQLSLRLSNKKLKERLKYSFRYPSYREGMKALNTEKGDEYERQERR